MAFVRNFNPNDDQTEVTGQSQGIDNTPTIASAGAAPVAQTAGPADSNRQTGSGTFTNLQRYLSSNAGGAENLGNQIVNSLDTAADTARRSMSQAQTSFGNRVSAGTNVFNPEAANSSDQLSGAYRGPTQYIGSDEDLSAQKAMMSAREKQVLAGSVGGRSQLLRNIEPRTSEGGVGLNQFLVQNTQPVFNKITSAAGGIEPLAGQYANQISNAADQIKSAQQTSLATRQQALARLGSGTGTAPTPAPAATQLPAAQPQQTAPAPAPQPVAAPAAVDQSIDYGRQLAEQQAQLSASAAAQREAYARQQAEAVQAQAAAEAAQLAQLSAQQAAAAEANRISQERAAAQLEAYRAQQQAGLQSSADSQRSFEEQLAGLLGGEVPQKSNNIVRRPALDNTSGEFGGPGGGEGSTAGSVSGGVTAGNVGGAIGAIGGLATGVTGLGTAANAIGLSQSIADAVNAAIGQSNQASVAAVSPVGMSQAGLAQAVDAAPSIGETPSTAAATPGPSGTGAAAAAAASAAASAAAAQGLSDAAIGAASQAAADAAISGQSAAAAAAAGAAAAAAAGGGGEGGVSGGGMSGAGGFGAAAGVGEGMGAAGGGGMSSAGGFGSVGVGEGMGAAGGSGISGVGGFGSVGSVGGESSSDAGEGAGSGGGGKIICTAMNDMYGLPYRENRVWLKYGAVHMTPAHTRGYHRVFLPLVDFGFKQGDGALNLVVRRALIWIAVNRTQDLEDEMSGRNPRPIARALIRKPAEKLIYLIGKWSKK